MSRTRDTSLADRRGTSASLLSGSLCATGLHRWLGGVPQQHQTGLSRQGETNSGMWSCVVAGLVGLAHWDGDQTHGEQAPQGGCASDVMDGSAEQAMHLLQRSEGGQVLRRPTSNWPNNPLIERLATLTRSAAMLLIGSKLGRQACTDIGSTYNFCCFHQELSICAAGEVPRLLRRTPAMASGLTDHLSAVS